MKKSALCQIPGFNYSKDRIANLPRPIQWLEHTIKKPVSSALNIKRYD